jgi:hypothetical protein
MCPDLLLLCFLSLTLEARVQIELHLLEGEGCRGGSCCCCGCFEAFPPGGGSTN